MKVLVIHPSDKTTDFLKPIYENKDWTVINSHISVNSLKKEIIDHDRIIMLGHGMPSGLIAYGGLIIDSSFVYLLKDKDCVFIWCNANKFVERYDLKGFYTGMIISEVEEAMYYNFFPSQSEVNDSNTLFTLAIKNSIDDKNMLETAKKQYNISLLDNDVVRFNEIEMYQR